MTSVFSVSDLLLIVTNYPISYKNYKDTNTFDPTSQSFVITEDEYRILTDFQASRTALLHKYTKALSKASDTRTFKQLTSLIASITCDILQGNYAIEFIACTNNGFPIRSHTTKKFPDSYIVQEIDQRYTKRLAGIPAHIQRQNDVAAPIM